MQCFCSMTVRYSCKGQSACCPQQHDCRGWISQALEFSQLVRSVVSHQAQDIFDEVPPVLHLVSCHLTFTTASLNLSSLSGWSRPNCGFPNLISSSYCSSVFSDSLSFKMVPSCCPSHWVKHEISTHWRNYYLTKTIIWVGCEDRALDSWK